MSRPIFHLPIQYGLARAGASDGLYTTADADNDAKDLVDKVFQSLRERFHGAQIIEDTLCGKYTYAPSKAKQTLQLHPDIQAVGFSKKELLKLSALLTKYPDYCQLSIPEILLKVAYDHIKKIYPTKVKQASIDPAKNLLEKYEQTIVFLTFRVSFPDPACVRFVITKAITCVQFCQHLQELSAELEKKPQVDQEAKDALSLLMKITKAKESTFQNLTQFPCELFSECLSTADVLSLQSHIAFCRQRLQACAETGSQPLLYIRSLEQLIDCAVEASKSQKKILVIADLTHKIFLAAIPFTSYFETLVSRVKVIIPAAIKAPLPKICAEAETKSHEYTQAHITLDGFDSCYRSMLSTMGMSMESFIRRISFLLKFLYAMDSKIAIPILPNVFSSLTPILETALSTTSLCMNREELDRCNYSLESCLSRNHSEETFESKKGFINLFFENNNPQFLDGVAQQANEIYADVEAENSLCCQGFYPKVMHDYVYNSFAAIKKTLSPFLSLENVSKELKELKKQLDIAIKATDDNNPTIQEWQSLRDALCTALTPCMISCILFADVKAVVDNRTTPIHEIFPEELLHLAFYGVEDLDDEESFAQEPKAAALSEQQSPLPSLTLIQEEASTPIQAAIAGTKEGKKREKPSHTQSHETTSRAKLQEPKTAVQSDFSIQEEMVKAKKIRKIKKLLNTLARAGQLDFSKGSRQRGSHIQVPGGITIATHGGRKSIPLGTLRGMGAQAESAMQQKK